MFDGLNVYSSYFLTGKITYILSNLLLVINFKCELMVFSRSVEWACDHLMGMSNCWLLLLPWICQAIKNLLLTLLKVAEINEIVTSAIFTDFLKLLFWKI